MATKKVRENNTPVDIGNVLYQKIKDKAPQERYSIRKYVNVVLNSAFKNEKFAQELFPTLEKIKMMDQKCFVRDVVSDKLFVIEMKNDKVWCQNDDSKNCKHVLFSLLCYDISDIFKAYDDI